MNTKRIILSAIIAALPFTANAENIQGDMYVAPVHSDNNHPAPTTNGSAPYGRVNIDTDDQEHIATTAYVKGAYNSAIAGVNNLNSFKQGRLWVDDEGNTVFIEPEVQPFFDNITDHSDLVSGLAVKNALSEKQDKIRYAGGNSYILPVALDSQSFNSGYPQHENTDFKLITAAAVADALADRDTALNNKRVAIYTTWGDDSAKAPVALANINDFN